MRILIVSDTHGRDGNLYTLLNKIKPLDLLVHCGDIGGSEDDIRQLAGCPVHMVVGNNDFFSMLPREEEFLIGSYHVWLTHGHRQMVSSGNRFLKEEAMRRSVDIVMYGHTHAPKIEIARRQGEVTAINPGSLTYPRQEGRRPSYILMELDREGKAHYHLNYL